MKKLFLIVAALSLFVISCGDNNDNGDSGNTGSDDDVTDTGSDETGDDSDSTGYECVGISIEDINLISGYASYEGTASVGDKSLEDTFSIQFYEEDPTKAREEIKVGTYDLGSGLNANYSTCTECALIYEDYDQESGGYAKSFFQMEGTIEITEVKEGTIESKGKITAKVVEVSVNSESFVSTPVEGGGCYEIQTSWDTICVPDCTDKVCGDDGCGGTCGDGCGEDEQCNEDGTSCDKCTAITLEELSVSDISVENTYWTYNGLYSPNTGDDTVDDQFSLQFYAAPEAKSYDLAGTNYVDCTECILVFEDLVPETSVGTVFFQEKGTVEVESFEAASGNVKATITGLQLREALIGSDYTSTLIKDGKCLILETGAVDVTAE